MKERSADRELRRWLEIYGGEHVSLAHELCDGHRNAGARALDYAGPDGEQILTYGDLRERSSKVAGALGELGVGPGDRVAVMLGKSPELLVAALAIWRLGAIHVPLFTAFGPDAVAHRVAHSGSRLVITDGPNRSNVVTQNTGLRVLCVRRPGHPWVEGDEEFMDAMRGGPFVDEVRLSGDDAFVLLYTSGTTGLPKGVGVPIRALASFRAYMRHGLDLRPDDVLWNMADPGWAYGLYYGLIGPLLCGQTITWRAGPFDARNAFTTILDHGVTNLAAAPTVFRSMRAAGAPGGFRSRHRLRVISSAGEPLNPELLEWSQAEIGIPIHDHYGQSELGMVAYYAHHPALRSQPLPASMGFPAPGYRTVVIDHSGKQVPPGTDGDLAVDVDASPQYWFGGYFQDDERTLERFPHGPQYYLTGDAARQGESGRLYFASRADDVITSSGYRIGPFEVENALMAHPAVAEVAVIGTPDELRGEAITAYVVPADGVRVNADLSEELQEFVRARLARHLYPRHVVFANGLPRTPSGKIRRNVLREQWVEAGGKAGDQIAQDQHGAIASSGSRESPRRRASVMFPAPPERNHS
jgi:acetyl-CoA synthetase